MPAGRPRIELTAEQIALIEKLAGLGLSQAQIADCLPMSERTLSERVRGDDPEIAAAYARGRAKDLEDMSRLHRQIARGELQGTTIKDQRQALQWRMERQHKWAERIEHTGPDGGVLMIPAPVAPDEWAKAAAAQQAELAKHRAESD